ncbi:MAG: hypothetical protein ACREDT_15655, partial [Methylocella sp.]
PALVDEEGRPHALLLTGGQVADIKGAASLLSATAASGRMIGDGDIILDRTQPRPIGLALARLRF